ncbi:MAG: NYN domain-containing protein [Planctomycetes bacterium]|nr:NYN domain-containing protein [Planctomycetota bacterium]
MARFMFFVDGSNLVGTLKHLGIEIPDYGAFYRLVFEHAVTEWKRMFMGGVHPPAELRRVQWYALARIDEWNLEDPRTQAHLRTRFDAPSAKKHKASYLSEAGRASPGKSPAELAEIAWASCFAEFKEWYHGRQELLAGFRRFYHSLQATTDFIDVIECGWWKVFFPDFSVEEKALDTTLAVDMVVLADNYDVALLVTGDADAIPSVQHVKSENKVVAAIEFLKGYPPEKRSQQASSRLKVSVDFVVPIYEMDLVGKGIGKKVT